MEPAMSPLCINDFGLRRNTPCGDCDDRGHCTMNCSPGEKISVDRQLGDIEVQRIDLRGQFAAAMRCLDARERDLLGLVPAATSEPAKDFAFDGRSNSAKALADKIAGYAKIRLCADPEGRNGLEDWLVHERDRHLICQALRARGDSPSK
jgi:hypothetical protein